MPQYDVVWSAPLATSETVAIGTCVVKAGSTHVVATAANRATYGRATGIALTAGDANNPSVVLQTVGFITAAVSGLGVGTQSYIRISATGALERCTPSGSDDVVGQCEANGDAHILFGTIPLGGYGTASSGTGSNLGDAPLQLYKDTVAGVLRYRTIRSGKGLLAGQQDSSGGMDEIWLAPSPPSWHNVRDYGAVGDGATDDTAAIQAAIANASGSANDGATVFFPEGNYKCAGDVHVYTQVLLRGVSGSGSNGKSLVTFAAGKQFIAWTLGSPYGGNAFGCSFRDLEIFSSLVMFDATWAPTTAYTVGQKIHVDDQNDTYLECLVAGTSGGSAPTVPFDGDYSFDFVPGKTYKYQEIVRGHSGASLITGAIFYCSTAGTVAGTEPIWDATIGHTTASGGAVFTAASPDMWVTDGTVVWAARVHAGIWARTRVRIDNVYVQHTTTAGIHIRGDLASFPQCSAGGWKLSKVRVVQCGVGIHASGADSSVGVADTVDVESAGFGLSGNGGIGIHANTFFGSTWIGCQVANDPTNGGGHSIVSQGVGHEVFINPYTESFGGGGLGTAIESLIDAPSVVIGGTFGGGLAVTGTSVALAHSNTAEGSRYIVGKNRWNGPAANQIIFGYLGVQDGWSAFNWNNGADTYLQGIGYSTYSAGWAPAWWTFGRRTINNLQAFALVGEGGAWPSTTAISEPAGDNFPAWIPQERIHIGRYNADPASLGFGSAAPVGGYTVAGSVVLNVAGTVGAPSGWICTATGTPGTWETLATIESGVSRSVDISAANVTLAVADDYATVTVGGAHSLLLSASPIEGKWHSIKNRTGSAVTVDGNTKNIDGAATFSLPDKGTLDVRYNATTSEWEIR